MFMEAYEELVGLRTRIDNDKPVQGKQFNDLIDIVGHLCRELDKRQEVIDRLERQTHEPIGFE
jgi:hypothetical protein